MDTISSSKISSKKAIEEEFLLTRNDLKGNDGVSVSFDQARQKQGKAMNSKSRHSSVIGEKVGKIVDYEVKFKSCRMCDITVRNGVPPRQHNSRKYRDGSSKSMEQESAVASLTMLREKGIEVTSFMTNEDSTIHHHISIRVPSTIRTRKTDFYHVKKSITKKFYKLRNEQKVKQLNPKTISYFGRCFGYCLKQNKGDKLAIKNGLLSIVPHSFGDHSKCYEWCRYKRDPDLFMFRSFPSGKPLTEPRQNEELSKIFAEYTKSEILERLACFSSAQANESLNQLISTKSPKARHYSGSASLSFRVAAFVMVIWRMFL